MLRQEWQSQFAWEAVRTSEDFLPGIAGDAEDLVHLPHALKTLAARGDGKDIILLARFGEQRARRNNPVTSYPELLANWKRNFHGWSAADFGWGADRTQNILWRLENGELDGVNPKVIVLLARPAIASTPPSAAGRTHRGMRQFSIGMR